MMTENKVEIKTYLSSCLVHLEDILTCKNYVREEQLTDKYIAISILIRKDTVHCEGI